MIPRSAVTLTPRWCAQSRDGWCALAVNRKPPGNRATIGLLTRCKYFITLPWGIAKREPTCSECLAAALRTATKGDST